MGNCKCDEITSIELKYYNRDIILEKESKEGINKITIITNIEDSNENKNFFNLINKIYINLDHFSNQNKSSIKMAIKKIIEKDCNKNDINNYLNSIENISKNKNDLTEIQNLINLFKFIYENKDKFDLNKIRYFIDTINYLLEETNILNEQELASFVDYLYKLFQIISKENNFQNQINKEVKEGKNISKIQTNVETENNKKDKEDKELVSNFDNSFVKNLERKESKQSKSSVFSTYSKESQHQILKMEKEMEKNQLIMRSYMGQKNINIIFYNEKENKEYPLMIPNNEKKFGTIYTYENNEIKLEDKIDFEENDKIIFEYFN